ncbi:MAG: hypothetical protein RR853_04660 [Aurantimicrobium sp.]|uniref:hypothetical protein n=1 Tax=Bacillati TaxID=1783272 RepID=UPI002FCCB144
MIKQLYEKYEQGGHYLRDKGDGPTRKHKLWRIALIAYGSPIVLWAIAHGAVEGAAEVIGEVNQFIRFNR